MKVERTQLLAALSGVFRKAPRPVDALQVTYAGAEALVARVDDGVCIVADGTGAMRLAVDLDADTAPTLADLAVALSVLDNVAATVIDPAAGAVLAATLLDDGDRPLTAGGITFVRWQNATWRLLDPVRRLVRQAATRLDAATAQLNPLTAAAYFADYWGTFTATTRRPAEPDATYTLRQLRELTRPRENNRALAAIIETDTGVPVVEVADLRIEVFALNGPLRGRPLPGRRYNTCTAEVRLDGFPSGDVVHVARENIAAGIRLLVRGDFALPYAPSTFDTDSTGFRVGPVPDMQIGVGQIGGGKIHP